MEYIIESETLEYLWTALNQPATRSKLYQAERFFQRFAKKGWAFKSDVEDIVDLLDSRLSTYKFDVKELSKALGIHWEPVCYHPGTRSNYVAEYDAIRIEDVALFLMKLERIGFQTDANSLVSLLLPDIKSRKKVLFSDAELEIFWFKKTRHKHSEITLITEGSMNWGDVIKTVKTAGGYTINLKGGANGKPTLLQISAPKFRKRNNPVRTTCPDCGVDWYKGDPDSSFNHRREHKLRMAYLDPKPSPEFLEEQKIYGHAELVTSMSPEWKHKEMYTRAVAFKREFQYDFVQWHSAKGDSDPNVNGFLFADTTGAIVGACSFRAKSEKADIKFWKLDWIWICPKERRKGHLTTRWEMLRERFGNFFVEPPVSDDMKTFLQKQNDSVLLNYPES